MGRFLGHLFHYVVPRFVTYYYLMPKEGEEKVVWVLDDPEDVAEKHRNRIVVVNTFLFLGRPFFSKIQSPYNGAE